MNPYDGQSGWLQGAAGVGQLGVTDELTDASRMLYIFGQCEKEEEMAAAAGTS